MLRNHPNSDIHIKPVHTTTLSLEDVHLLLAGSPADTRIHLNPSKRMGGRKLRSNFRSMKIQILPQYNILTLGAPCRNCCSLVWCLYPRIIFMMLLLSNHWHLHTWMCLKIKPTGYSNWAAGAKQGIGQGWAMGRIMLEGKRTKAGVPLLLRQHRLGTSHQAPAQSGVTQSENSKTNSKDLWAKQKALVILSTRYSSHQHLPV